MLGIVGTIPDENFPLISQNVSLEDDHIVIGDQRVSVNRGTPALIAAAAETLKYMKKPGPFCYLVGDIGNGKGCKRLYEYLADNIADTSFNALTFHYFQPDDLVDIVTMIGAGKSHAVRLYSRCPLLTD